MTMTTATSRCCTKFTGFLVNDGVVKVDVTVNVFFCVLDKERITSNSGEDGHVRMELEVVLLIEIVFFQVKQLNVLIPGSENLIFSGVMGNIQKAVGILQCCCSTHRPTENVQGDTSKKNGGFSSSDTVAAKLASHTAEGTEECAQGKAAEANAAGGRIGQLNDLLDGPGTAELLSEPPLDDVPR
ncbi:hypothetical protein TYRP_008520 [Tyrophagus putrescentiae]|nr:hypothetical protein TYRP_008520 [Tyrophagus putrescentiae]